MGLLMHSRVADALCGYGLGVITGMGLAAAYLFSIAARVLGERPLELLAAWLRRR
jgi:hypothetical protein